MNRGRHQLQKSRTIANPLNSGGLLHSVGIREHYATSANRSSACANFQLNDEEYTFANGNNLSHHLDTVDKSPSNKYESDLVVVLDLDECLVHSQFLSSEVEYRQYEDRPQAQAFRNDDEPESIFASACESFRMSLPDGDLVHVNKRPNLDTFLQEVTSRYETHIFTAAMEVYASPLLDKLDPARTMFHKKHFRDSCSYMPSHGVYVKDLKSALEQQYNRKRVVLVDNNPMSFIANPKNGILVSNFYDDPKDDTLRAVLELLEELEEEDDVRPLLHDKFGLKDALKEVVGSNTGPW